VNPGTVDVASPSVSVELSDEAGQPLGTATSLIMGDNLLRAGQRTVWRAVLVNSPVTTYKDAVIKAFGSPVTPAKAAAYADKLAVSGVAVAPPATQGASDGIVVSGEVTNGGTVVALGSEATIGLYDAAGALYAVDNDYVQLWNLTPGTTAPFSVGFPRVRQMPADYAVYIKSLSGTS
jgi:hypothetical protein